MRLLLPCGNPRLCSFAFGQLAVQQRFEFGRTVVQHAGGHSHYGGLTCGEQRVGYAAEFARAVALRGLANATGTGNAADLNVPNGLLADSWMCAISGRAKQFNFLQYFQDCK